MSVYAEAFGLSLCISCSLSRLFPRRSSGISFSLCATSVWLSVVGTTITALALHIVILDVLFCLAQVFICFQILYARPLLHPRMDDRRKWMGSQLPHQRWCRGRGAQTRRSALRWRFHNTRHRRTTFSLACLLQFYRGKSSASGTPLVFCVPVGVCLQQRSAPSKRSSRPLTLPSPASSLSRTRF